MSLQSWYTSMVTRIQFDSLVHYFYSTRTARITYAVSQNQSDTLTVSGLDIFFRAVPHEFPMWGPLIRSQKEYEKFVNSFERNFVVMFAVKPKGTLGGPTH